MIIACPDCGAIQKLPPLGPRTTARCPLCKGVLEQTAARSIGAAFALSISTFMLLVAAYALPFLSFRRYGFAARTHLGSGIGTLMQQEQVVLGLGLAILGFVLPLIRFGLLSATLGAVRFGFRPRWLARGFRWAVALELWAMPDVFLLACIVGYNRVAPYVVFHIYAGGYCLLAAAILSMVTHGSLDRRTVWRAIAADDHTAAGGPFTACTSCDIVLPLRFERRRCPRCGARVHLRKPAAMARTLALTIGAAALYLPGQLYPMTVLIWFGGREPHNIYWGVQAIARAGLLPLAALVFFMSVIMPVLKLMALGWCLTSVYRRSDRHLVAKTKLYRVAHMMGRWSNMDPFAVAVFLPLVQFAPFLTIRAGIGSPCFFSVVILSMFASRSFDPRLMWDAAGGRRAAHRVYHRRIGLAGDGAIPETRPGFFGT